MKRLVIFSSTIALTGLGLLAAPAHADGKGGCPMHAHEYDDAEELGGPPISHAATPFVMPDLISPSSWGVEVGYLRLTDFGTDLDVLTTDVFGQVEVSPNLFVFGRVPVAHIREAEASAWGEGVRETDLGNISGGLRYVAKLGSLRLGASGSVSLATSPRSGDTGVDVESTGVDIEDVEASTADGAAALFAGLARYDTLGNYLPNTRGLQAQGDLRYDLARGFIQAQLGIEQYRIGADRSKLDLMRGGLALGMQATEHFALIGEATGLSYGQADTDLFSDMDEQMHYWLNLGARYSTNGTSLGARLYMPMDSPLGETRDEVGVVVDLRARL